MNLMPVTIMAGSENETSFAEYLRTKLIFLWPEEVGLLWSIPCWWWEFLHMGGMVEEIEKHLSAWVWLFVGMLVLHCSWTLNCISSGTGTASWWISSIGEQNKENGGWNQCILNDTLFLGFNWVAFFKACWTLIDYQHSIKGRETDGWMALWNLIRTNHNFQNTWYPHANSRNMGLVYVFPNRFSGLLVFHM